MCWPSRPKCITGSRELSISDRRYVTLSPMVLADQVAYVQQCAYASVTLSSATVDLSSTSAASSTSGSGSSSSASSSASASSSSAAGSTSSASTSSSGSATSQAASSVSSIAASSTPSNPAPRSVDGGWIWGLTSVGGVVVAAALGL
jgi:hypothetical protein